MSLVFSAICPHPPLLVSTDKNSQRKLLKTKSALEKLQEYLYAAKPDVIIIISAHGDKMADSFVLNQAPDLKVNFTDFGDLETKLNFKNEMALGYRLREAVETVVPLALSSKDTLDYGSGIPLLFLTKHLKNCTVMPIYSSALNKQEHWRFGKYIRQIINHTNQRIAIIVSGNLSHRLTKEAVAGYVIAGKKYNQMIIDNLQDKKIDLILELDEKIIKEADECLYNPLLIMLGIIAQTNFETNLIAYQNVLGVGYLTAQLVI